MITLTNQQMLKKEMNTVIKQLKNYHYKNTKEYMKKLENSDSEEYWDEYVLFTDEEFMENYKKKFVYSSNKIVNYKTKKPINIKIIPV
jgi:hypothetical protein|tara:strand:- start:15019 stop:15282 length:264 start_codon:yes stop_codon:yes gene_type:complete